MALPDYTHYRLMPIKKVYVKFEDDVSQSFDEPREGSKWGFKPVYSGKKNRLGASVIVAWIWEIEVIEARNNFSNLLGYFDKYQNVKIKEIRVELGSTESSSGIRDVIVSAIDPALANIDYSSSFEIIGDDNTPYYKVKLKAIISKDLFDKINPKLFTNL